MGLKDLEESLARKEAEIAARNTDRAERENLACLERERAKTHEAGLRAEKLGLARKIFKWVGEFAGTDTCKRITATALGEEVYIYGDGWGHEVPHREGYGLWSRIYVNPDGTLCYFAGFKWAGGARTRLAAPEELAAKLNHEYLSGLWRKIETGEVYDAIKKWHFKK